MTVESTRALYVATELARPYNPEAVAFVVGDAWASKEGGPLTHATAVPYLSTSAVIARLNKVCPGRWMQSFRWEGGHMWADLTIDGIVYSDIGDGYTGKALLSDARKRSAWAAGIGLFLRAVPAWELTGARNVKPWRMDGEPWLKLTRAGEETARRAYDRWLTRKGGNAFGEPIDHGDLTARGNGEGPPMPVTRPGEKAQGAKKARPAPPKVPVRAQTVGTPAPVDPEAQLAELLSTDAPTDPAALRAVLLRRTVNDELSKRGDGPAARLKAITDAGDTRGLSALLTNLARDAKVASEDEEGAKA